MTSRQRMMFFWGIIVASVLLVMVVGLPFARLTLGQGYYYYYGGGSNGTEQICDSIDLLGGVVGTITNKTPAYRKPDLNTKTGITYNVGKRLWVLGHDVTGNFYEVAVGCSLYWIPAENIGPTPGSPWFNSPLPDVVIVV